jgi:FKBP-type peptidyl-prolyl cis-trans isomerase
MRYVFYGVLVALLTMFNAQAGQIYQCGDTFQDRPCAGNKSKVIGQFQKNEMSSAEQKTKQEELEKLQAQTAADAEARYNAEVAAANRAQEASVSDRANSDAIRQHRVIEGMSAKDVVKSWGDPDRKKQVTTKYGLREEWTYVRDWGNKEYVYFDGDSVSEVSLKDTNIE